MIRAQKRDSPALGLVYEIFVDGDLPKMKGIDTFKFRPDSQVIWVDGPGGTITFAVDPI